MREAVFMLWLHFGMGDKELGVLCGLHAVHLATSHLSHCTPSLNTYEDDAKGTLDANEDCGEKEVSSDVGDIWCDWVLLYRRLNAAAG